jgi:hypothetical protein
MTREEYISLKDRCEKANKISSEIFNIENDIAIFKKFNKDVSIIWINGATINLSSDDIAALIKAKEATLRNLKNEFKEV